MTAETKCAELVATFNELRANYQRDSGAVLNTLDDCGPFYIVMCSTKNSKNPRDTYVGTFCSQEVANAFATQLVAEISNRGHRRQVVFRVEVIDKLDYDDDDDDRVPGILFDRFNPTFEWAYAECKYCAGPIKNSHGLAE